MGSFDQLNDPGSYFARQQGLSGLGGMAAQQSAIGDAYRRRARDQGWLDVVSAGTTLTGVGIDWAAGCEPEKPKKKSKMPLIMELQHETDEWLKDVL